MADGWGDVLAEVAGEPHPPPRGPAGAAARGPRPPPRRPSRAAARSVAAAGRTNALSLPLSESVKLPTVPRHIVQCTGRGSTDQWPLLPYVRMAALAIERQRVSDQDVPAKLNSMLMDSSSELAGRTTSKASIQDSIGVTHGSYTECVIVLANTIVHFERDQKLALECYLANTVPKENLLHYVEAVKYDETPMKLSVNDSFQARGRGAVGSSDQQQVAVYHMDRSRQWGKPKLERTVIKLLQSSSRFGYLLRTNAGEYVGIVGASIAPLQWLDRNTGECLREADQRRTTAVGRAAKDFACKTRVSVLDGAGPDARCEAQVGVDRRGDGWGKIGFTCSTHCLANVFTHTFDLTGSDVSSQINFALAVNEGSGFSSFCRIFRAVVQRRIRIRRGRPPPEATPRKRHLLCLSLARGSRLIEKKTALHHLPNGDWRDREHVDIWIPEGIDIDESEIKKSVSEALEVVLLGARFTRWPRSRWAGSDVAMDEFILLDGIHGLGSAVWAIWAKEMARGSKRRPRLGDGGALPAAAAGPAAADGGEGGAAEAAAASGGDGQGHGDFNAKRLGNEYHRSTAEDWMDTSPLDRVVIIRQVLEPLRRTMDWHLEVGGKHWEIKQRGMVVQAESKGAASSTSRTWPIVEAALGTPARVFQAAWDPLFREHVLWKDLVQPSAMTRKARALAFKLLSRSECQVREAFTHRHSLLPTRTFAMIVDPAVAQEVSDLQDCRMDSWTKDFVLRHKDADGGLSNPAAIAVLNLLAATIDLDIKAIESHHASIRRRLMVRGVQTHSATFAESSAEWVVAQARLSGRAFRAVGEGGAPAGGGDDAGGPGGPPGEEATATVRGTVSSWHALLREQSLGQTGRQCIAALSAAYRALPRAEVARLAAVAAAANGNPRAADAPGSAFGLRSRDLARAQAKRRRKASEQQLVAEAVVPTSRGGVTDLAMRRASADPNATVNMDSMMRAAQSHMVSLRRVAKTEERKMADAMEAWESTTGAAQWASMCNSFKGVAAFQVMLSPMPSHIGQMLEFKRPTTSTASIARSLWMSGHGSNMKACLASGWMERHRAIMRDDCAPVDVPVQKKKYTCAQIGMCICCPEADVIKKFRRRFYSELKGLCTKGSPERKLLDDSSLVVRLRGIKAAVVDGRGVVAAGPSGDDPDGVGAYVWWHIGSHEFSPYCSNFRPLAFVEQEAVGGQAFSSLDLTADWSISFWVIDESDRAVARFRPADVVVVSMGPESELRQSGKATRRATAARPAATDDGDDGDHGSIASDQEEDLDDPLPLDDGPVGGDDHGGADDVRAGGEDEVGMDIDELFSEGEGGDGGGEVPLPPEPLASEMAKRSSNGEMPAAGRQRRLGAKSTTRGLCGEACDDLVKRAREDEAVFARRSCDDVYIHSLSLMTITDVVASISDDVFKKDFIEGKMQIKKQGKRPLFPEEVGKREVFSMKVKRKALIMSRSELHRYCGFKPTKKNTKSIPSMMLHSEDSLDVEGVWLFMWTIDWSFLRALSISMGVVSEKSCAYMKQENHIFASQSTRTFDWSMGEQTHSSGPSTLLANLKTHEGAGLALTEEMANSMGTRRLRGGGLPSGGVSSTSPPMTMSGACSVLSGGIESTPTGGAGDGETDSPHAPMLYSKGTLSATTINVMAERRAARSAVSGVPSALSAIGRLQAAAANTCSIDADDSASQAPNAGGPAVGKGDQWIAKLPLSKDKDQWNRLTLHMTRYELANKLHETNIFSASAGDVKDAFERLRQSIDAPPVVQKNMCKKMFQERMTVELQSMTDVAFFFEMVWPWPTSSQEAGLTFTADSPKLHFIDLEMAEKIRMFNQSFISGVHTALIEGGHEKKDMLVAISSRMASLMDDLLADAEEFCEGASHFLGALGSMVGGVAEICDPTSPWKAGDIDAFYSDILSLDPNRGDIFSGLEGVAIAIGACAEYSKTWATLMKDKVMAMELAPQVSASTSALLSVARSPLGFDGAVAAATAALSTTPKVACSLGDELATPVVKEVKAALKDLSASVASATPTGSLAQTQQSTFIQLLGKAVDAMPSDAELLKMKTEMDEADASMPRDAIRAQLTTLVNDIFADAATAVNLRDDLRLIMGKMAKDDLDSTMTAKLGECACALIKKILTVPEGGKEMADAATQAAHHLHDFLPSTATKGQQRSLEASSACRSLRPTTEAIVQKFFDDEKKLIAEQVDLGDPQLALLRVLLEKLDAYIKDEADSDISLHEHMKAQIHQYVEDARRVVKTVGQHAVDVASAETQTTAANIEPYMHGLPDGTDWLSAGPANLHVWKNLAVHADSAILSTEMSKTIGPLKKNVDAAEKALAHWKSEGEKYGLRIEGDQNYQKVSDIITNAWVTLVTGSLFMAFKKATDKQLLRATIVKTTSALKERGISQDRLHPTLSARVQLAMQFKIND
ncbi:unnamed protein product [Prorocentrum cordatum]|uniref:Calmodulin n=1 Tax=Prorocentrum cordatum TaxID=2364126 RepID=A0ABN9P622_9DINO|nr:unnamed protein product [Polarella glacialis]